MTLATAYAKGAYRAGEGSLLVANRFYKPDGTKRGILAPHGAGVIATWIIDTTYSAKPYAIAEAGIPVAAFDLGDPAVATGTTSGPANWGNDNSITAMGSAKTWLQTAANGNFGAGYGAATAKFGVYAGSMGALAALNYLISLADPAAVCSCIALTIPVLDLNDIYQNDKNSYRAQIGSAYGVTYPTAIPSLATHSPAAYSGANLDKLTMPIRIWSASDDSIASTTSSCNTWATSIGANCTVTDLGAVGHSSASLAAADLAAFFIANI